MEKLLEVLKQKVEELSEKNKDYNLTEDFLEHLYSVYPFNKFEFVISHLIATQTINLQQYLDLRNDYCQCLVNLSSDLLTRKSIYQL